MVGDVEQRLHHRGDVALGVFRQVGEVTHLGNVLGPAGVFGVNRLEGFAHRVVARNVVVEFAAGVFVGGADQQFGVPRALMGEGVEFVDHHVLEAAVAQGVALFHRVVPANHALAAGGGAEFEFFQQCGERVGLVHLGEEHVGTDLGVVGLGHAECVDRLHRDAGALEKLRGEGVRGGDVGRKAVAFVQPVGLAEFPYDSVAGADFLEDQLADFADVFDQALAGLPVGLG